MFAPERFSTVAKERLAVWVLIPSIPTAFPIRFNRLLHNFVMLRTTFFSSMGVSFPVRYGNM
jgi:hypothetical protein